MVLWGKITQFLQIASWHIHQTQSGIIPVYCMVLWGKITQFLQIASWAYSPNSIRRNTSMSHGVLG